MKKKLLIVLGFLVVQSQLLSINIGDRVIAYHEASKGYFVGTAVESDNTVKGGGFLVIYDDGDQEVVPIPRIKKFNINVGSKVRARYSDGKFYPGVVNKIVGNALYILFDDGEKSWTSWSGIGLVD